MKVAKAEYISDYKVWVQFSDGICKIVDFQPLLKDAKNPLKPLLDLNYFKEFETDGITICWPNGVDFCPDVLYEIGKSIPKKSTKSYQRNFPVKQRSAKLCKHCG